MADAYFSDENVDDVLRTVLEKIFAHGGRIFPTKGEALELTGVLLEISNPRARISRTETRGKLYSCLGELFWYLSRANDVEFISYYIPFYKNVAEGGKIYGGYGPRLFNWKGVNQLENVIRTLKKRPDSRQAVIQLFDAVDIKEKHLDVPCTCTLQFMVRDGKLHLFTSMRSNDVYSGFAHDMFCFTMLQEIVARSLSVELGSYKHAVGSLHLYVRDMGPAKRFLREGWQPTEAVMPSMPAEDPWPAIAVVLGAESNIRNGRYPDEAVLSGLHPYWADLIRLLRIYQCKKHRNAVEIRNLRGKMSSNIYFPFIDRALKKLEAAASAA